MKSDKPNVAAEFIAKHRKRFFSLYPSTMHFLNNALLSSSYYWHKGVLVCREDYSDTPSDITEKGWETLRLAFSSRLPTSFEHVSDDAPLFNLPADIHHDWVVEIDMFLFLWGRVSFKAYKKYVEAHFELQGYTAEATKDCIKRSLDNFADFRSKLKSYNPSERLFQIRRTQISSKK